MSAADVLRLGGEFEITYRLPGQRTDKRARMQLVAYNPQTQAMLWNCRPAFGDQHFQLAWIKDARPVERAPSQRFINHRA